MIISEKNRKWWALTGISIASLVIFIDFAIVNTALPAIQKDLRVSFVELQWVMNIFVLTLSIFMVNMGRFGDIFGSRLLLYIGLALFGVSTVFAGLARDGIELIIFRALQGIAVSILIPSALALVSNSFPENERGRAIGLWTGTTGIGLALGPVLGGIITSALSWRWVFFVNVPILIIGFLICLISVKEREVKDDKTIDWPGFFLMIAGLGSLVTAVIQGPEWGWGSNYTISLFAVAIISLAALYIVETRAAHPIIDFKLFFNRGFLSGAFANFTLVCFAYSAFFLIPLFLGNIKGEPPFMTGLILLPITALIVIVGPITGRIIDSHGAKLPILAGLVFLAVSSLIQISFKDTSPLIYIIFSFIFMGIGWGFIYGSGAFAAISSLPGELAGTATGALWTFQNLGGSIGLAISGVIFRYRERLTLDTSLYASNISLSEHQETLVKSLLSDPEKAKKIMSQFTTLDADKILLLFQSSFMKGYGSAFTFLFCVTVATFVLIAVIMKSIKKS